MTSKTLPEHISYLQQQAQSCGQRRLLVISGDVHWCRQQARVVVAGQLSGQALYIGENVESAIPVMAARQSRQWLGRELDFLVFDAHCGFDVDAFGAISGTLCAGGLMVLLTPDLDDWSVFNDPEHKRIQIYPQTIEAVSGRYLHRLARLVKGFDGLALYSEQEGFRGDSLLSIAALSITTRSEFAAGNTSELYRTTEQMNAVTAIHKVVRGHRKRPLVLTADRGRGKSAALGIAAGQLLQEGVHRIIVTAPSSQATEVLFRHAREVVGDPAFLQEQSQERLVFIAPDELIRTAPVCDLLLVDEAAAIPAPLLERMLKNHARIVFASTIHGYEGTGRGFAVRFRKVLDQKTPQWREMHIKQPVRWADHDPLEQFVFQALLLNAAPADVAKLPVISLADYEFRRIRSDELINNEPLLKELFGLLVLAHYQTRPFDLRHMLDGGNIEIYGLLQQGHVIATVLAAREGNIEPELVDPIWLGQRRVRGHLLPQSLSNHLGIASAVRLQGLRIIRIAVHPERQNQGLGQQLINELRHQARSQGYDYLGTSFGATTELLSFWESAGLRPVRMGMTREAASGTHSVLMIQALSTSGETMENEALQRFQSQFHWLLMDGLADLDALLVVQLLQQGGISSVYQLSEWDQRDLQSYSAGQRLYDSCLSAIRSFSFQILLTDPLSEIEQRLIVGKVLQNKEWSELAGTLGLPGRRQVQALLRDTVRGILSNRSAL